MSSRLTARGVLALVLLGATVGSFLDGFHSWSGTTVYPSPVFWKMAWWTPLLFGVAYAGLGSPLLRAREPVPSPPGSRALAGFVGFAALYFASGFLPAPNVVKLALLLAGAGVAWALVDRSRAAMIAGAVAAVVGPATEITLVGLDAFSYVHPDFAGIAMWLPALYLLSGPAGGPFARLVATEAEAVNRRARYSPS